jgi:c-di-GMP-binding flagellar brake protein YcgR
MKSIEFRKFIRSYSNLNVKYKSKEPLIEGRTLSKNISATGINIFTTEKLKKGTTLELEIELPENHEVIFVKGTVIWQAEVPYSGKGKRSYFSTGIEFTDINSATSEKIGHFVFGSLNKYSQEQNGKIIDELETL